MYITPLLPSLALSKALKQISLNYNLDTRKLGIIDANFLPQATHRHTKAQNMRASLALLGGVGKNLGKEGRRKRRGKGKTGGEKERLQ